MINKEKLLSLGGYCACPAVTHDGERKPNCEDYGGDCKECAKANIDFHIKYILKFKVVYGSCTAGDTPRIKIPKVKEYLCGSHNMTCDKITCDEYVIEWLKEDFKSIFNGFKTGDAE